METRSWLGAFHALAEAVCVFQNSALIFLAGWTLASVVSAWWIYRDARARYGYRRSEPWQWAIGTLLLLVVALPAYLLFVRPPGGVQRCPSCGRATLSHRAVCLHCQQPIPFDAPPAMWGLGEIAGIALVFGITLPGIAGWLGIAAEPGFRGFMIYAFLQSALLVVLPLYVVRRRYRQTPELLGLRPEAAVRMAGVGVALGGVMVFLSAGIEEVAIALVGVFVGRDAAQQMADVEHMTNPVSKVLLAGVGTAELIWILVLLCVAVPVAEEIFFRGFVYRALRARWGVLIATLASAVFFGAVHLELVHFLPIAVLGVVLAYSLERTGSLAPAIAVHAVNNAVAVFAVLYGWNI